MEATNKKTVRPRTQKERERLLSVRRRAEGYYNGAVHAALRERDRFLSDVELTQLAEDCLLASNIFEKISEGHRPF